MAGDWNGHQAILFPEGVRDSMEGRVLVVWNGRTVLSISKCPTFVGNTTNGRCNPSLLFDSEQMQGCPGRDQGTNGGRRSVHSIVVQPFNPADVQDTFAVLVRHLVCLWIVPGKL